MGVVHVPFLLVGPKIQVTLTVNLLSNLGLGECSVFRTVLYKDVPLLGSCVVVLCPLLFFNKASLLLDFSLKIVLDLGSKRILDCVTPH